MYRATTATNKLLKLRKRIRAVAGGTSASKTISILLILIDTCQSVEGKLVSIVSESMPHLKKAAMRDFLDIMHKHGYYQEESWNRTDSIYTFHTGSQIEFFGVDSPDKVRGPRRDILFINEANNVPAEAYNQLEVRTRDTIWLDWNPTNEFWFYTDVYPSRAEDIDFITLTYLDNEALEQSIIDSIESRRHNKSWWKVYGLGQLGEVEGRIYTNWVKIDEIPHEALLKRRGLDFGYSNDPAALIDIYSYNGGFILNERLYQKGMLNKALADFILNLEEPSTLVMADCSEPKSIDELRLYGINILPVKKGPDSIRHGISFVQDQKISYTSSSVNLQKEYQNYLWQTDKDGHQLPVPTEDNNHLLDGVRYGFDGFRTSQTSDVITFKGGDSVTGYGSHPSKGYKAPILSGYRTFSK